MRATQLLAALISVAAVINCSCAHQHNHQHADLVTNMPGLQDSVNFNFYSGYLDASENKKFHYIFFESQGNPANDPVVLWLNGGPGCSSVDGCFSENGPLLINNDGKTLRVNPYSWNKLANVLYIESPAGVGYSYDKTGNIITNDDEVAENNYAALLSFMKKFPQFSGNKFFITGESYGGIYLPTLATKIVEGNVLNFQGMAVGNGLSSYNLNTESLAFFASGHGLFGRELLQPLTEHCCHGNFSRGSCQFEGKKSDRCTDAVNKALAEVFNTGLNMYALYMDCYHDDAPAVRNGKATFSKATPTPQGQTRRYAFELSNIFRNENIGQIMSKLLAKKKRLLAAAASDGSDLMVSEGDPECMDDRASTKYMNNPLVRTALHIEPHLPEWEVCNMYVNNNYKRTYNDMYSQYTSLLQQPRNNSSSSRKLNVLLYNGDTDMACNFLGDEWFVDDLVDRLGLQQVRERSPWYVNKQVGGFAKSYHAPATGSRLTFTTVRGAGHMVPQWAPKKSFYMYKKFLAGEHL